jgi:hypothetical protein
MGKYDDWTRGDDEALINRLGGLAVARRIKDGELTVRVVGNEVVVEPRKAALFDKNGRRIPPEGLRAAVYDANYQYAPTKLDKVSYAARLERLRLAFGEEVNLPTPDEFESRIKDLVAKIEAEETIKNVLKGAWYPVCIPGGLGITLENYGEKLDTNIVPAVKAEYERAFSGKTFYNNMAGQLAGEVNIWNGSRHERLVEAASKGPVVGIYFPTALQGYSINAEREQMASLPKMFWLAGALDALVAQVMYPQELLRDNRTPYYDMAATEWRGWALCGYARVDNAYFGCRGLLDSAYGDFAGGVFVCA